nr:hypothetical protein [Tanacetum cinerariifolium]
MLVIVEAPPLCLPAPSQPDHQLKTHISENGFDSTYTIWDKHGESLPPPPPPPPPPQPPSPVYDNMAVFLDEIIRLDNESTQTTGSTWMTSLDFLAKMSHAMVLGKITDSGFNLILKVLQEAFPHGEGFKIPSSYYKMKKTYKKIRLGYESIHACMNDCFLFWGSKENEKMQNFPICNASRWKYLKTKGKKVANKVVRYFPLIPRLQRLNKSQDTAKWMTWHSTGKSKENSQMNHPVDGKAWKFFDIIHFEFAKDPRNIRLGVAVDGFNPFGNLSQTYSTDFKMKVALLWTINDFPARSSLSRWFGQGYLTCLTCNKDTQSAKVRGKIVYVGHRKFLRIRHTRRMKRTFNGKIDMTPIPKTLTNADIMNQLRLLPRRVTGKHSSNKQKPRDRNVEFNWNKRSIFYDLEYWPTLQLKHNFDVMHIEKNVIESLLGTLLMNDKSKDTIKARQDLEDWGIRKELWLVEKGSGKFKKPHPKHEVSWLSYNDATIYARKLMQRDMEKAKEQLINIIFSLEKIYPPAFFDVMIHLVMHLPEEAILGGSVYMRWMYPFERYMKKLKNYVRNKAKPEGSIAEGYVPEEALTFCSHYLKGVETRFNRLDKNGFGLNPTDTFKVFQSLCEPVGKEIRQKSMENDPQCSPESELFSLACGPESNANSYATCVVNGVKFLVHDRDIHRTTQSSRVATPGPNGEMFYGQLEEILELTYIDNEVPDEESADFIGDEDDVVSYVLEDDDQDDDVRNDDDPASVHVVSSEDEN